MYDRRIRDGGLNTLAASAALRSPWVRYSVAVLSCLVALLIRLGLDGVFPPGFPYVSFFPAVFVTAYFAGLGPAIVCTLLGAGAARYLFMLPVHSFALTGPTGFALLFFICVAGFIAVVIGHMRTVTDRLLREQARTTELNEQHRVMFQELQHRVANNMQFVASLLHLQKRKVRLDPQSVDHALDEASARIELMAKVHRRLYDPSIVNQPIADYFKAMSEDVIAVAGSPNIDCVVEMPAIKLDIERLMLLSLLVTEVITNCVKHAFVDRPGGTIALRLEQVDAAELELTIQDNGRGFPEDFDAGKTAGLGSKILKGLASQLHGKISMSGINGTTTRVRFPAAVPA